MTDEISPQGEPADSVFAGRIDILYALGRHYLSLPFAVLCVPATLMAGHAPSILPVIPLLLQMTVVIAAEQLTTAYKKRSPGSDPHFWARRYTFVSAISGATWGVASLFWFVWDSFPAQAYLSLAFLGMAATEFIARSAHRPAYLAHTLFALGPLVGLLLWQGGIYADCTAVLIVLFTAVLISYCRGMARLLDESVYLRNENGELVIRLQREKSEARGDDAFKNCSSEVSQAEFECAMRASGVSLTSNSPTARVCSRSARSIPARTSWSFSASTKFLVVRAPKRQYSALAESI